MQQTVSQMDKKLEMVILLDFYGALLTKSQQEMMRLHYDEDYSLKEIADVFNVTRQAVHDTVTRGGNQLLQFEQKLGLYKRFQVTNNALKTCKKYINKQTACQNTEEILQKVSTIIDDLMVDDFVIDE